MRIRHSTAGRYDSFVLLDAGDPAVLQCWQESLSESGCGQSLVPFTVGSLEQNLGYPLLERGSIVPGCAHYPLLDYGRISTYANYWLVEYDVEFTGNWGAFFDCFRDDPVDLLISHLAKLSDDPDWYWWSSFHLPRNILDRMLAMRTRRMKGFTSIYRISGRALRVVDAAHRRGWRGHVEAILPTVLRAYGLSVRDFNTRGKFYIEGAVGPNDGKPPYSSLRWRPLITSLEMSGAAGPLLFHPVK